MSIQSALPAKFAALEPFAEQWGDLHTPAERYLVRQYSRMEDLRAFHTAAVPLLDRIFEHLDSFPYNDELPPAEARLFRTVLGLAEVQQAVEVYGSPRIRFAPFPHHCETTWVELGKASEELSASKPDLRIGKSDNTLVPYNEAEIRKFDVGFGETEPDKDIMKTGLLPPKYVVSQERFDTEKKVFENVWLQVARVEEIATSGDWVVREVEICNASIIIVNDGGDRVRAFHNVCLHRGTKILWEPKGHGKRLTCPYHSWSYGTDGSLASIPDESAFPEVCKTSQNLTAVAVDIWEGFIFINLNPDPPMTLTEYLGPVVNMYNGLQFDEFTCYAQCTEIVNANWKLGVDAGGEGYHVSSLHRQSAAGWVAIKDNPFTHYIAWEPLGPHRVSPFPTNLDYSLDPNKPILSYAISRLPQMMVANTGEKAKSRKGFGDHPDLNRTKAKDWGGDQLFLFPVGALNFTLNGFYHNSYWPISPDKARWNAKWYFVAAKTHLQKFAQECSMAQNRDIVTEDNGVCAGQHKGLKSGATTRIVYGEGEMLPRHMAAVWKGLSDQLATTNSRAEPTCSNTVTDWFQS